MKLRIHDGVIVSESGTMKADIYAEDGKIQKIGEAIDVPSNCTDINANGMLIFPGFIDTHTHLDMQTATTHTADDFYSGTRAAVSGGTTTVLDFATQNRGETLMTALKEWHSLAEGRCACDYGFHMAITDWNYGVQSEISEMTKEGVTSYKLYMAYDTLRVSDGVIFDVLNAVKEQGGIVGMHCENGDLVNRMTAKTLKEGITNPVGHVLSRPDIIEEEAICRYLEIAALADAPVNIVHLSTKKGLEAILRSRAKGQKVYVETCPQYLLLTEDKYRLDGFESAKFVISPPLRTKEDADALWEGVENGEIDTIGSDHCSFRYEDQKSIGKDDFSLIPNGAPGVDLRPQLMYTYGAAEGRIGLPKLCSLLSSNAARLFGMYPRKGALLPGSDADITIWDPSFVSTASDETQQTAADYTPFAGMRVRGRAAYVFCRGELAAVNGEPTDFQGGRYIHRNKCEFWR